MTEEEIPEGFEKVTYTYVFSPDELLEQVAENILAQARALENESHAESLKGNADREKIRAFDWGSTVLARLASDVARFPLYELRTALAALDGAPIDLGEVVLELHQVDGDEDEVVVDEAVVAKKRGRPRKA